MPVNTPNNQPLHVAYGQTQGLISVFNPPVISNRAPTVNDRKAIGTLWVNKLLNNAYIETSVVNSQAQWQEIEIGGGGAGNFSSLTVNPGPTNISTVGSGAVTIGNAANTGLISFQVGTGNFELNGNGNTIGIGNDNTPNTILIGNVTSGTKVGITGADGTGIGSSAIYLSTSAAGDIQIGATTHTGTIRIGTSTTGESIFIGTGAGANTIGIGGTGANAITIANAQAGGSFSIGALMTTGTISIGGIGAQTGTISIAPGTGAQTINIANAAAGSKTINIGAGAVANTITVGNETGASTVTLNSGTGGTGLSSTGAIALSSTDNHAAAINISTSGGVTESISIQSLLGTGNGAVSIGAASGGVDISGGTGIILNAVTGNLSLDTGAGGAVVSNAPLTANGLYTIADEGGIAGTVGFTNVVSTATGAGTVTFAANGATNIAQAGWLKFYVNGTAAYIPYFTTIA
jgi:fibronectin-binding autotransporter adhesin